MSAQEIIEQLSKLDRPGLEQVDAHLRDLLERQAVAPLKNWGGALLELAGTADDLPSDFAHNHDHYLHGLAPR